MRIALLTPGFSKDEQDWCIPFLYDLVKGLAAQHDVQVFALRYPPYQSTYRFFGATVHAIGGHHTISGWRRLRLWQQTAAAIHAEHGRVPFDVIHAIWADETGFLAESIGKRLGIPSVVTVTGGEAVYIPKIGYGLQRGRFQRWQVRRALRADMVIAPSQTQAGLIKALAPEARVTIAPFGVDTNLFAPAEMPLHPPRLIAAGSLIPVKNHALLLHALARLQTPGVQLEIAGEGVLQPALEQLARDLGIADRVIFSGKVDHGALASHFQQADLHVLTSYHEGFGLVNIEAAACGLPTVGFAVGVVPELEALGAAISVKPDAGALAAALELLLNDEEWRDAVQEGALNAARTRYSLAAMVEGVIQTYEALVS